MLFLRLIPAIRHQMPATTAVGTTVTSLPVFGRLPPLDHSVNRTVTARVQLHFAGTLILCP